MDAAKFYVRTRPVFMEVDMESKFVQMVATIAARFIGKTVNFLVFAVLAHKLSVSDMGLYGFVFATTILISTGFDFGVRNSVAYFIGQRPDSANPYARATLRLFAGFAIPAAILMYGLLLYHTEIKLSSWVSSAVLINLAALLFIRMGQGILIGEGRIGDFNQTELASRVVLVFTTGGLLAADLVTLPTALISLAVSNFIAAFMVLWFVRRNLLPSDKASAGRERELITRGFKFMIGVLAMLTAKQMAFLIVSQLGSPDDAGVFFALRRLTEILTEIGLAVSVVVFSQNVRATSRTEAIASAAHSTRVSFAIFVILTVIAMLPTQWLLQIALDDPYSSYPNLFRILLLGTLVSTIWTIVFPSMSAIDDPIISFFIFLPNLLISALITVFLFEMWGLNGAAVGMTASHVLITASFLLVFKTKYNAPIRDFIFLKREDFAELAGVSAKIRRRLKR